MESRALFLNELSKRRQNKSEWRAYVEETFRTLGNAALKSSADKFTAALSLENRIKNRYANILPFDYNLVQSPRVPYINASPVQFSSNAPRYIATQGPLANTAADFYEMALDGRSQVIVMLTQTVEGGREKCYPYWPTASYKDLYDPEGRVKVSTLPLEPHLCTFSNGGLELTKLAVSPLDCTSDPHVVYHLYFKHWPDFQVAQSSDILHLIKAKHAIEEHLNVDSSKVPAIVHCSAGVGRTGTFCAIETALGLLSACAPLGKGDFVAEIIQKFRLQRAGMVQTSSQLELCYDAILLHEEQSAKRL